MKTPLQDVRKQYRFMNSARLNLSYAPGYWTTVEKLAAQLDSSIKKEETPFKIVSLSVQEEKGLLIRYNFREDIPLKLKRTLENIFEKVSESSRSTCFVCGNRGLMQIDTGYAACELHSTLEPSDLEDYRDDFIGQNAEVTARQLKRLFAHDRMPAATRLDAVDIELENPEWLQPGTIFVIHGAHSIQGSTTMRRDIDWMLKRLRSAFECGIRSVPLLAAIHASGAARLAANDARAFATAIVQGFLLSNGYALTPGDNLVDTSTDEASMAEWIEARIISVQTTEVAA